MKRLVLVALAAFLAGSISTGIAAASLYGDITLQPGESITIHAAAVTAAPTCTAASTADAAHPGRFSITGFGLTPGTLYQVQAHAYASPAYVEPWVYGEVLGDSKATYAGVVGFSGNVQGWFGYWWEVQVQPSGTPDNDTYIAECEFVGP